jgi:glycosyltransferase involved in cell wall biosynthesis
MFRYTLLNKMEKIFYIVNARMPTQNAHGIQIAKMCEAFTHAGADVTLVLPRLNTDDLFEIYKVEKNFTVVHLPVVRLSLWMPGSFMLQTLSFALSARWWLSSQKEKAVVYTRGEMALFLASIPKRFSLVWETHIKPAHPARYKKVAERTSALVAVTKYYAKEIPNLWNVSPQKVLYVPDGVDLDEFAHPQQKEDTRKRLELPLDKKIALYIGRVDGWKGVDMLLQAAALLPEDTKVAIIGGEKAQVSQLQTQYSHVLFLGPRPYAELADNQAAADVLVLTGDSSSDIARYYTSPLKLFTYMASGVPIVATDLPSFRDVLSESQAFFYESTPEALAQSIQFVFTHRDEAYARASNACKAAAAFSWKNRAQKIITFITDHS